ncbi:transporter [Pelagicoccus sp. SDUM812002]|uniref:transporter n=1 Tax=Pelagicoccus sp. SDUM812002 TaxID=3041266 RepID=UPI00281034AF|nr:transporter [Pelagicoccus sp. SDUM812002]MDQ8186625.1 transporter [Pelagicoccus sp. SDUM812002]
MNNTFTLVSTRTLVSATMALGLSATALPESGELQNKIGRADSHAPIGVMGDHLHRGGEFMFSFRHMSMGMDGHRQGENSLTTQEVFAAGFSTAATKMDMEMDMLGFMYAPSDSITLMLMANHLELDMDMMMNPHVEMGGMHGGHSIAMSHSTSGWGDVSLTALVKGWESGKQKMHWNLGVSAPTGSVSEMMHGTFQPYGMQLGSGTWDAKVGATYTGLSGGFGWGAQALGTLRLEDSGESGFSRSDALEASVWGSWLVDGAWSLSTRLKYTAEGPLDGHYNGAHAHSAPPHFQANYGGDVLEGIIGLNYLFRDGALKGNRLALEYGQPLYQQLNGVGMNREDTLTLGWQYAW